MKRRIIIEMNLTDTELSNIVPSGTRWVELFPATVDTVSVFGPAEIISVNDLERKE